MGRMLSDALAEAGWVAEATTRLPDALLALQSRHYCAVVSEVEIPGGDGFELLTHVRALPGPPPAVILTSFYTSPDLSRRAGAAGAFGCLGKPFDVEALLALLETACRELARA